MGDDTIISAEEALEAVKQNSEAIEDVPEKLKTPERCSCDRKKLENKDASTEPTLEKLMRDFHEVHNSDVDRNAVAKFLEEAKREGIL